MEQRGESWRETARSVAEVMGLGAKRLTDAARRQIELSDLRAGINAALRELGLELGSLTAILILKARVRELEGDPVVHLLCPRCGREVKPDDVYCRDCGEKL